MSETQQSSVTVELASPVAAEEWREQEQAVPSIERLAEAAQHPYDNRFTDEQAAIVARLVVQIAKGRQAITDERLAQIKVGSKIYTTGFFKNGMHFSIQTERRSDTWVTHLVTVIGDRYTTVLKAEISDGINLSRSFYFEPGPWIKEIFA